MAGCKLCDYYRKKAKKEARFKFKCLFCNTVWQRRLGNCWYIVQNGLELQEKVKIDRRLLAKAV